MEFIQTIGKLIVRYHSFFEEGIVNTLIIAAFTVFFGTIFGTLMSSMRMSKILPLKWLAVAYIEFIRGTPLMVQLMFIFYGLPMVGFTLPDISWIPNFSRFSAGIIAMSINSCAYVAEIIRSGVQAVDVGQMEAARSVGFSHGQAMRLVVLPQAIKNILPALGNEFVTVIKESSIVSVIGLADLMFRTNDVIALTFKSLACLAIAALCYFAMTFTGGRSGRKEDESWQMRRSFRSLTCARASISSTCSSTSALILKRTRSCPSSVPRAAARAPSFAA